MPAATRSALYILPFDHRNSYVSEMFGFKMPLDDQQQAAVEDSKQVIYEGFLQGVADGVPQDAAAVLVDQQFGTSILRDAAGRKFHTALSVEKSGVEEFQFEYGDDFAAHIEAFDPTYAKVLVRYNPEGDAALNERQNARLKKLSDYCAATKRPLMFELLVPATKEQLVNLGNEKQDYDLHLRPQLMINAVTALQDAGIEPAVWKIEGLDLREDCQRFVAAVRRNGRDHVDCIVLGRGADEQKVVDWLQTAASVDGFIGFAVGRTTFSDAIADYIAKKATREQAVQRIAERYLKWTHAFQHAQQKAGA